MHPFYDTHTHIVAYGVSLDRPYLGECRSFGDVVREMGERGRLDSDTWLVGRDFDETTWKDTRPPTLEEMDRAFPDRPVVLRRVCGHIAVANSKGLERIGKEWDMVHRDTGLLEEDVVLRLDEVIGVGDDELVRGVRMGVAAAHSFGIVGSAEIVNLRQFRAMRRVSEEIRFRFRAHLPFEDAKTLLDEGIRPGTSFGGLRFSGIKVFMDGSLGGRTAALEENYADAATRGMLLMTSGELHDIAVFAQERGLRMMVHAIGDRAVAETIKGFKGVFDENVCGHTIEHAEVLDPRLISELKRSGLYISMQPNFALRWSGPGSMNMARLGRARHRRCDPYGSVLKAGIPLGFGSDCMPLDPFLGLRGAVGHPVREERMRKEDALALYTYKARKFIGISEHKGDDMELSGSPFEGGTKVISLKMDGRTVYSI